MQRHLILLLVSFISIVSVAQKKVITHDDYDRWMKMGETQLSEKGNIIVYNIEPITPFANSLVEVYNTKTKTYFKYFFHNNLLKNNMLESPGTLKQK